MKPVSKTSRVLGIAFLPQFVTSEISGLILRLGLIVPGNISKTMLKIANNAWLMRAFESINIEYQLAIPQTFTTDRGSGV
jgi:hypothetical protein